MSVRASPPVSTSAARRPSPSPWTPGAVVAGPGWPPTRAWRRALESAVEALDVLAADVGRPVGAFEVVGAACPGGSCRRPARSATRQHGRRAGAGQDRRAPRAARGSRHPSRTTSTPPPSAPQREGCATSPTSASGPGWPPGCCSTAACAGAPTAWPARSVTCRSIPRARLRVRPAGLPGDGGLGSGHRPPVAADPGGRPATCSPPRPRATRRRSPAR